MDQKEMIQLALKEDMPEGDISSMYLFEDDISNAKLIAKEEGVLSGIDLCEAVFLELDPSIRFHAMKQNGEVVHKGEVFAKITGKTKSLLMGERVALNFIQRMSGIATKTRAFVSETEGTKTKILDTRKTTPLLRAIEKRAVLDGSGVNHRFSLSDMVMLKDNHIKAAGSITEAVNKVKSKINSNIKIEVEVETIEMFLEALKTPCDIIMLDNMTTDLMAECVKLNHTDKKIEASGNMTLSRIKEVANTGVDFISVGSLTHSYSSLDISMRFE